MVLIIRSNSIISDSRVNKYIKFLSDQNIPYHLLGWNRTGEKIIVENATLYNRKSGYNLGGYKAVYHRLFWFFFCFKFLIKNKYLVIHGCDLDSVFPVVLYKIMGHRKVKIIFDIFDWYSATLSNQHSVIKYCFSCMEYLSVRQSNYILICESERLSQIPYKISCNVLVLPNIPYFSDEDFLGIDKDYKFSNMNITFSYVGGLYGERFLAELLNVAEKGLINLLIAGYGDVAIERSCTELSRLENVRYFGKVDYKIGLNIMYNSDLIYAMYCKTNPNHIYAAPNKYYEAMMLAKPILSTKGTIIGDKIEKNNLGYTIEEKSIDLINIIDSFARADMVLKGQNGRRLWDDEYKYYTHIFFEQEYIKIISS